MEGKQFLLVNIYAPNKDEPQFFANIVMQIESFPTDFKIIGGDMNVTLNEELDRFSKKEKSQGSKSAELINEFLETENWVDIWRVCHPETKSYTWRRRNPLTMSRLDYFFIPHENIGSVIDCQIQPGLLTDHSFIESEISITESLKG